MSEKRNQSELVEQIQDLRDQVLRLEAELAASEGRFRSVTDSAPVGIFLDDAQGKAIYINQKCAELIGVPAESALNFDWIPFLHPDDRERMVSEWERCFNEGTEFRLEYRWVHEDGRVVWTLGQVVPIRGADGEVSLFVGTLTDVTARKQAELEREKLHAQLTQAQKMESIGRLAGGVAHDYNNMLNAILCYTELAMGEVDREASVHGMLGEIHKATIRSAEITRQLMTFARKQMVSPKVLDLNESVEEILQMIGRLIGEGIDLVWRPASGRIPIKVDPAQLDGALVNLCINARDAMAGKGTITIESAMVHKTAADVGESGTSGEGPYAVLSVEDTGCGMDEETLGKIFEPFFTTKDEGRGIGLGLASVYGSIQQSGGFIDVVSRCGEGSTFTIHLPLYEGSEQKSAPVGDESASAGHGETILVVEDEAVILEIARHVLGGLGYRVLSACGVSEALERVNEQPGSIDLLLTDIIMPEMNGRELARKLQAIQPDMKCLYMSGYTSDALAEFGVSGDFNLLQKPFSVKDLGVKVAEALGHP